MIYFCYFLTFFLVIRLLVSLVNALSFRYLPNKLLNTNATVSVLIPARNEEQNIENLLSQLNDFSDILSEIIVYDDHSTDKTADIAKRFVKKNARFKLIQGGELAKGWLGKNHACHTLAKEANGDVLLFLDADVKVGGHLIERALSHMQKHNLELLSIFPKQIFGSLGEKVSVPLMNWILLSLLPLILVRVSKNPAFSAANGQFMMFNAKVYKKHLPHQLFRAHMVEDIATIQYFKQQRLKSDTLLGDNDIQCRMYDSAQDAITGFTKNIFQFFGNSALLTILVGITTTIAPFVIYLNFGPLSGVTYLSGIVLIRIFVSIASRQSVIQNVLFLCPQHLVFLSIILKRITNNRKKELIWKGRNVL